MFNDFKDILTKNPDHHILTFWAKFIGIVTASTILLLALLLGGLLH